MVDFGLYLAGTGSFENVVVEFSYELIGLTMVEIWLWSAGATLVLSSIGAVEVWLRLSGTGLASYFG